MVAIARFQESRGPVELDLERRGLERVVLHDKVGNFTRAFWGGFATESLMYWAKLGKV